MSKLLREALGRFPGGAPSRAGGGAVLRPASVDAQRSRRAVGREIEPRHEAVADEDGHRVVAVPPLRRGDEGLEAVCEVEEFKEPRAVADERVEGREEARSGVGLDRASRPAPVEPGVSRPRVASAAFEPHGGDLAATCGGGAPVRRLARLDRVQMVRDLPRGRRAEPIERLAAAPRDERAAGRCRWERSVHALREVVDLVEAAPPRDRDLSAPPEMLERRLMRRPVPPALAGARGPREVAGRERAALGDRSAHLVDDATPTRTEPRAHPGALSVARAAPLEAVDPPGKPVAADDARVVRPVLEQAARRLGVVRELHRAESVETRVEDQVMRALDRVDAVDLHEAEPRDGGEDARARRAPRGAIERASGKEEFPRVADRHDRRRRIGCGADAHGRKVQHVPRGLGAPSRRSPHPPALRERGRRIREVPVKDGNSNIRIGN